MQKNDRSAIEITALAILFCLVTVISFYQVEKSISVDKYLFEYGINNLLVNYDLFHHSFKDFLYQSSTFHTGDSEAEWRTIIYLLPLFLFCDLFGGLSLKMVCFFTVTTSLIFLVLFYWWIKRIWGSQAAFGGTFFLGFSTIFQEFARSGSYDAYSILLGIIWALFCFRNTGKEKFAYFLVLGLLTGLLWYGYSLLRPLALVAVFRACMPSATRKWMAIGLLLLGMALVVVPGIVIMLKLPSFEQSSGHLMFIDKENIFDVSKGHVLKFLKILFVNVLTFIRRLSGQDQYLEGLPLNLYHARFWHPWLLIPLLAGVNFVFRQRRNVFNQLLLILCIFIYLPPSMTSTFGFAQARRSLLYVIPSYCFIGIGMAVIYKWINSAYDRNVRRIIRTFIFILICLVLVSEAGIYKEHILTSRGDAGLLAFSDRIKKTDAHGTIFYFEDYYLPWRQRVYFWAAESDILRMALMDHGRSNFLVQNVELDPGTNLGHVPRKFYVVKSPLISTVIFRQWCIDNDLKSVLLFTSPYVNMEPLKKTKEPFKFYAVYNQN